jgi:N4-gp56 family major capsid protein
MPYNASYGIQYGNGGRGPWNDTTKGQVADTGTLKKQLINDYFKREALIDQVKEQYFQPLATVTNLAPNSGKYIKQYVWRPLLDDRNINDQGIDATGATYANGNIYGSSKDISTIQGKLPVIGETGGRYNRVGFTRDVIEGTISDLGFFFEFSKDELQFDTEPQLLSHFTREALRGANEITEDVLQMDLINGASANTYYCGAGVTANSGMGETSEITYNDLIKIAKILTENRVPKQYKMFTGSTNTDTRTVAGGWTLYVGPEMRQSFMAMTDLHNRPAFVPVEQYASGVEPVKGEIGRVYEFRIVEVPEMLHYEGAGASIASSPTMDNDGTNYNVYPMLIIGAESFTTIGFRTNGKSFNFEIMKKMPGEATMDFNDPYGRRGIWSIQWTYGTMILRSERLMCIKSVARV